MNPINEQVASKASEFSTFFKTIIRNGSRDEVYVLKDDAPDELKALIRKAHGDFMPDDFRYETILDALYAFAECEDADMEDVRLEADIYTTDLQRWFGSHLNRVGYCDQAQDEFGLDKADTMTLITYGQQMEKDEIVSLVREYLISLCT